MDAIETRSTVAVTAMLPVLTVIADGAAILGAAVIAHVQLHIPFGTYWNSVVHGLYMRDLGMGIAKPFVLGFLLVTIASHVGLATTGGTQGVGRATTRAVVIGSIAVLAADFFVTQVLITIFY